MLVKFAENSVVAVGAENIRQQNIAAHRSGTGLAGRSILLTFIPLAKVIQRAVEAVRTLGLADPPAKPNQINMELNGGIAWQQRA